ncbi:TPA: hypothetical protein ACH3X2_005181 [Trebouxia sp. C0005]
MFKSCFVARVAVEKSRNVELFCTFDDPRNATTPETALPPAQALGAFCFPLGPDNFKPKEYEEEEEYSFTLTAGDGSRLHGFCRSFLPPWPAAAVEPTNSSLRYPQVLCVISQHPWFSFYYKILQVTEKLLEQGNVSNTYSKQQLALNHPAGLFLTDLCHQCPQAPIPGKIIRVHYPKLESPLSITPPKRIGWTEGADQRLTRSDQFIELELPPDFGNGSWNAGIPLAPLLWHVPVQGLMTLLAALLLERRVILVAEDRNKVTAAVHAAAALLYPFRWQHIYLPLLPIALKDYLTAPMPFLIGLQASLLPSLKHLPMDEVTLIDLDLGTCQPPPGSPTDDACLLPWAIRLQAALQVVYDGLRSPTEFESTPVIAHVLQEYFLRLLGRYREFVQLEGTSGQPTRVSEEQGHRGLSLQRISFSGDIKARPSFRQSPRAPGSTRPDDDGYLRGDGFQFHQLAFVEGQRRSDDGKAAQTFLTLFRHSQLYEVFINERLKLASQDYKTDDNFESKVAEASTRRAQSWGALSKAGAAVHSSSASVSNLTELMHKSRNMVMTFAAHHRLTSEDNELFPSREGSFVRSSGSSFGGRSGSSFTGRLPSRTGATNLQRFSGSAGGSHANGSHPSATPRDVNSVKAQINGIMHEDSLPYYDQVPGPSLPSRQSSVPLPRSHNPPAQASSPRRFSQFSTPTRLQAQASLLDLGDLGVSSPTGMSRANSRDSGHISTQSSTQSASGSWQGRLSRSSAEQHLQPAARPNGAAQRGSPHQASAYSSIEAMLSSIPETLSSIPSMPSVPSMSEIERSMQSGWTSFTGSLGLSHATQQEAATPAGWTAFAEESSSVPNTDAAPAMPAAAGAVVPSIVDAPHAYALSSAMGGSDFQQSRLSVGNDSQGGQPPPAGQTPLGSPRRKPTGLQSIDPLTAAKEAASVPLRAMPSYKQMPSPRGESQQQGHRAHSSQDVSNRSAGSHHDDAFAPKDAIASNDWSDFAAAHPVDSLSAQQSPRQHAQTQDTTSAAVADLWTQWSVPAAQDVAAGQHTDTSTAARPVMALTGQLSLLDL